MGNNWKIPKNTRVLVEKGPPCPRCEVETEIREHIRISDKSLKRPFYYSRWYNCLNLDCKTNLIMPEEFRVYNSKRSESKYQGVRNNQWKNIPFKAKGSSEGKDARIGSGNFKSGSGTPPWYTDEGYAAELRLEKIKEQLKPRE